MRRLALAAVAVLALCVPVAVAQSQHEHHVPIRHGQPCAWHHGKPVLFTVKMAAHAGKAAWAGTRTPTRHDWHVLLFIARCQHNSHASSFVHAMYRGFAKANAHRRWEASHPWSDPVTASWFDDGGGTSCGTHYTYGFATLRSDIPCGMTIEMIGPSGVLVAATREDSGPYVAGREFDLNPGLRDALGCGGLCSVRWRHR